MPVGGSDALISSARAVLWSRKYKYVVTEVLWRQERELEAGCRNNDAVGGRLQKRCARTERYIYENRLMTLWCEFKVVGPALPSDLSAVRPIDL